MSCKLLVSQVWLKMYIENTISYLSIVQEAVKTATSIATLTVALSIELH